MGVTTARGPQGPAWSVQTPSTLLAQSFHASSSCLMLPDTCLLNMPHVSPSSCAHYMWAPEVADSGGAEPPEPGAEPDGRSSMALG